MHRGAWQATVHGIPKSQCTGHNQKEETESINGGSQEGWIGSMRRTPLVVSDY